MDYNEPRISRTLAKLCYGLPVAQRKMILRQVTAAKTEEQLQHIFSLAQELRPLPDAAR